MNKQIEFLKKIFLKDLTNGESAMIIDARGAESGLDHLRIYTQSETQKENGVVTMMRIYSEEITETQMEFKKNDEWTCGCKHVNKIEQRKCGQCFRPRKP